MFVIVDKMHIYVFYLFNIC